MHELVFLILFGLLVANVNPASRTPNTTTKSAQKSDSLHDCIQDCNFVFKLISYKTTGKHIWLS